MVSPAGVPPPTTRPRAATIRRSRRERAAAWLVTGPLGHLYGTLADILALAARRGADRDH